jgi:glutamate-ammonia-ligase adenylyltransferase
MTSPPTTPQDTARDPLRNALQASRYAKRVLDAHPQLASTLDAERPFTVEEMRSFLAGQATTDDAALGAALRQLRTRVMLRLIVRDLNGLAALCEVTQTVTALADVAIETACTQLDASMQIQYGTPTGQESGEPQRLMVVGMGKLGGRELNVSSDIDLIFLYGEDGETTGPRVVSNTEYFTRLARRLIAAIGEITADGFVFRVDMRLRPYGESGPLVCNLTMFENYLVTQGREWERYAWIKGRLITGEQAQELESLVRPFVFRRHLDYGALAS